MVRIRQAILVEGRYDKNKLLQFIDAPVFETSGFGIMKDKELQRFLKKVAEKRGLIILTDSDGAGFVIRNFLKGILSGEKVLHAYIPDIPGKEKRKKQPGKEGKLGVEGMTPETLLMALKNAGAVIEGEPGQQTSGTITKQDFYTLGLTGKKNSAMRRRDLLRELSLPERMSTNALLTALNMMYGREELFEQLGTDIGNDNE